MSVLGVVLCILEVNRLVSCLEVEKEKEKRFIFPNPKIPSDSFHWNSWSAWTSCSCGDKTRTRYRSCHYLFQEHHFSCPVNGRFEQKPCNTINCQQVNGEWTAWSPFSACSQTCGQAVKTRTRSCTNPSPANGGKDCIGLSSESAGCKVPNCPVNGHWTPWSSYGACSQTCGYAVRSKTRSCTDPKPTNGGKNCSGEASDTEICSVPKCPVNGGWSNWSSFGRCSLTCGNGTMTRTRSCTNPAPTSGGTDCKGDQSETNVCNIKNCKVNGMWSTWGKFRDCDKSCGGGIQLRFRSCTDPPPSGGGQLCYGDSLQYAACNTKSCPEVSSTSSKMPITTPVTRSETSTKVLTTITQLKATTESKISTKVLATIKQRKY